ncbi:MAG: hypothetical protein WA399_16940 [Acidobacteriaceae bacterium]
MPKWSRFVLFVCFLCTAWAQSTDHLSDTEIAAAVAAPANSGFVDIMDAGFMTPTLCTAQMPSEAVFTPAGWVNVQSALARRKFLPFHPNPDDTVRALRIISKGCANGTPSGPVCDSITRVVLLSDKAGTVTAEAIKQYSVPITWQNGHGATTTCANLISLFSMDDVTRVRKEHGEFLIATFNGSQPLKTYTVKEKHLKKLGL